jgi:hypothetical protein
MEHQHIIVHEKHEETGLDHIHVFDHDHEIKEIFHEHGTEDFPAYFVTKDWTVDMNSESVVIFRK